MAQEILIAIDDNELPVSAEVLKLIKNSAQGLAIEPDAEAMIKRLYQEWGVYDYYWG